jgi:glycerol-3-phosphate dehydrogenase
LTSLNDLSRNRTLGLLIGKGFFSADYKSNSVILEGLNAIEMFHDLVVDKDINAKLPLFNKVRSFFANQETELEFKFDELIDLKNE